MNPSFKFKYNEPEVDKFGRRAYSGTMLVEMPDGTLSTYRAGAHRSMQRLKDDFSRMMAGVNTSSTGVPVNVPQNYGTQTTRVFPNESVGQPVLSAPKTFFTQTPNQDGTLTLQEYDQRGIRQDEPLTYLAANREDPNYNPQLDAIMDPVSGLPVLQTLQGVYDPSTGFNPYNADAPKALQGVGSVTPLSYQKYLNSLGLI